MSAPKGRARLGSNFQAIAAALIVSALGDVIAAVGYVVVAYTLTRSEGAATLVVSAEVAPYLLFGLVGGALSAVVRHLPVMLLTDLARALTQFGLAIVAAYGCLTVPVLVAGVFLTAMGGTVFTPCARAAMVVIVPEEMRVRGNALVGMGENLARVSGPAVGVGLAATGHPSLVFLLNGLTFAASFVFISRLRGRYDQPRESSSSGTVRGVGMALRGFVSLVSQTRTIQVLFLTTFLSVLANTWPLERGRLLTWVPRPGDATGPFSVALTVYAAAAIGVSYLLHRIEPRLSYRTYAAGVVSWGAGLLVIGLVTSRIVICLCLIVVGVGVTVASQSRVFIIQSSFSVRDVGQAFSLSAVILYLGDLLSLALFQGARSSFSVGALFLVAGTVLVLVGSGAALQAGRHPERSLAVEEACA